MFVDPDADTLVMTLPFRRLTLAPVPPSAPGAAASPAAAVPGATVWPIHSRPSEPQVLTMPVPRRPWRAFWCLLSMGHFWFPGSDRCLDCGRRRWRWNR